MDTAVFSNNKYGDIGEECRKIIEFAERKHAILTILWHQRSFSEKEFPSRCKIYEDLIKLCEEKDAWITTAGEIARWWTQQVRNQELLS